jgi:branched-subunit amino acid ABC-type transport system permease component
MLSTWMLFLLLGVGTGALYAALAMGVIVVYRGSGVVNFSIGASAMFPAVVFAELRTSGDLLLPVVVIPNRYAIGDPMGLVPAGLIALTIGVLISVVAYLLIFRPLRSSPPLTAVIATVGLTIVLQGLAVKSFGTATVRTPAILPQNTVEVFGRTVPVDRFWLAGIVALLGVALAIMYRRSRFGLATRAASTNEKGATLLGYDGARLGMINWVLASLLVSSVGILSTSLGGVNPFNYSLYVVPALGAALAARLTSLPIALVAGIAIGSFETLSVHIVSQRSVPNFFLGGFSSLVPFLVIVGSLIFVGAALPNRATILERFQVHAPMPSRNPILWVGTPLVALAILSFGDATLRLATIQTMFVTTVLLSIVVLTGYVGQVSLAQLAFAGFSAFMLSRVDVVPFPFGPLLAIAITTAVGTLIGIPALRIRGIQFAIVTFSAALVFEQLLFRSPTFVGSGGIARVDEPELFGIEFGILADGPFPRRIFGIAMLAVTMACALMVANIRRGPLGRRFLAVRINERAAAASGINIARTKLLGAAMASFLASVAGVMFAYKSVTFNGGGLEAQQGLEILALGYLGGVGYVSGAVIGGLLSPSGLGIALMTGGEPSVNLFILTGVGLILVTVLLPGGISSLRPRRRNVDASQR